MPIHWVRRILAISLIATPMAASELRLENCESQFGETARCGWAEVLEDRSAVDGRKIRLRVVVLPSRADTDREPLVLFPGGPGQATPTLIPIARQVYPEVQQDRDIVFVGQRGAGESNAMNCLDDIAANPSLLFGALWNRQGMRECWERTQDFADPRHYTTRETVADAIEVLDRLGYGRVLLWGGSGGTRIAQAFIRAAPERVVAAVLDGVTPIDYGMPLPFSRFAQRAWDRVVEDCRAQAECARSFPDLDGDLRRLFAHVAEAAVPTEITLPDGSTATVPVAEGDLAYALRGLLYNANAIRSLPARVHRSAESGDLSYFAQSLYNRSAGLLGGGVIAVGLHINMYCAEDVSRIDEADVQTRTVGTFLGEYLVDEYRGACSQWAVEPVPETWYRDFESQVPTLMVSGYYDPSTPDVVAEELRRSLPNSRHLVVRDVSHGAGFTCARPVIEEFLQTPSFEGFENPCPDTPIVFETDSAPN